MVEIPEHGTAIAAPLARASPHPVTTVVSAARRFIMAPIGSVRFGNTYNLHLSSNRAIAC
jgi:hypothetical protein